MFLLLTPNNALTYMLDVLSRRGLSLRFWRKWGWFFLFISNKGWRQSGYERSEFPFCFERRGRRRNGTRSGARGAMEPLAAA